MGRLRLSDALLRVRNYELARTHGPRELTTTNRYWKGKTVVDAIDNPIIKKALEKVDKSNWQVCETAQQADQQSALAKRVFANVCNALNQNPQLTFE